MSYGFRIVRSDGTEIVGPGIPGGGLFIGARYVTAGSSQTWTFPKVPSGDYLRILQNLGGNHLWNVGTIGGQATLTATAQPTYGTSGLDDSQFLVFSTYTVEDLSESYGLAVINDIGERLVSANFHLPQFLGKLGNGSWTLSGSSLTPSGYTKYRYSQSTGLGSGRNVLVLWNIPNSTDDVWYYVPYSYFTASGSYNVEVFVYANSAIHTLPEAFVFAVDGHTASADTYGIRCYNSSGQILFDSGLNHMTVDVISSGLAYPARDSTTSAAGMFSDTIPLFFIPRYTENEISPTAPLALNSYDKWWFAAVKRTGSTLHSQLIQDSETTEDIYVPSTQSFYLGQSAGLTVLSVKGSTYGATSIGSSSPTILMSPSTLPSGTVGTAYSQTITASGGTGPYTFSTVNGSLPAGLSLASNGAVTGTPTTVGSNSFKIRATDANTYATSTNYAILIQSGLLTSPFVSNFSATYNPVFESGTSTTTLSFDLTDNTASGAPRTVYWKVVGGSGTTAGDFTGTIQSSVASINGTITRSVPVTVYADNTTEGTENFHLELFMNAGYTGSAFYTSTNVTIVDNSLTPSPSPIYIPPSGTQNYDLTAPASVTEGNIITFTLNTQNVEEGTLIPYTITGIQSDDIVGSPSLSGNWYVGLPSQPRYTNYGQLGHWNVVIDPAPGLAGAFFKKGLEVIVSEEPYWNNVYGITGTALSDAITAAHSAGFRAGINLTPYAESGDGVNAGTATRQDLKDLINNYDVDFVAMDPYWFLTNGMNIWTTGDLTSWTDDIIATALAKGCYVKLVVQGFYDTGTLTATTAYRNSQLARSNIEEFINYDTPGPWSTIPNAAFSDQTASTSTSFTMATGGSAENETMTMSISVASIVVDTVNVTVVDSTPTPVAPSPVPTAPSPVPAAPSPVPAAPSPTPSGESYLFILPGFGATVNEGSSITFTVEGSSVPLGTVRYWRVFSASDPLADASDVTALTGSVTLNVNAEPNVNGSFTVTAATDANSPETGEGFFARLYLTSGDRDSDVDGSLAIASSQNVTIINTTPSPVPAAPSPVPTAPSPTPTAPSYNEVLFISGPGYSYYDGNYWVCENTGQAWYIEISGGMPNDSFTSNAGNSSLDGSGTFISGDLYGAIGVGGTFNLTVNFAGTGHTRTMTIKGDSC